MIEDLLKNPVNKSILLLLGGVLIIALAYIITVRLLLRFGKNPKYLIPSETVKKISLPLFLLFFSFLLRIRSLTTLLSLENYDYWFNKASTLLFLFAFTWLLIKIIQLIKQLVIKNYDLHFWKCTQILLVRWQLQNCCNDIYKFYCKWFVLQIWNFNLKIVIVANYCEI